MLPGGAGSASAQRAQKAAKIQAKDLVRTRKYQVKFVNLVAQLRGLSFQMTVRGAGGRVSPARRAEEGQVGAAGAGDDEGGEGGRASARHGLAIVP